jgi:hypothetical protein
MVDFNNEATLTTPLVDTVKLLIMESRENVLQSLRLYYKTKLMYNKDKPADFIASMREFFFRIESMLKNGKTEQELKQIESIVLGKDFNAVLTLFREFEKYLYDKGLTKIDNRKNYDSTLMEEENKGKGL